MSLIYRLEHRLTKKGIFDGRFDFSTKGHITELINVLSDKHRSPHSEDNNVSYEVRQKFPLRKFESAIGNRGKICHFAFTEYAFEDAELAKALINLIKMNKDIVLRKIENPEIVWVARSGIQVVFLDKQKKEKPIKEEMGMFNELPGE